MKAVKSGPFRLLDGVTGRILWSYSKEMRMFLQPVFSGDGRLIAAGVVANVRVYETKTGRVLRECTGPTGSMVVMGFSPDAFRIAAGGPDHNLYIWDLNEPKRDLVLPLKLPNRVEPSVESLAFESGSDSLVAFTPRNMHPGLYQRLIEHASPDVTPIEGALIIRRGLSPRGATELLLDTKDVFTNVRVASNARRFIEIKFQDRSIGVWSY